MTLMLTGTWSHSSARTQARISSVFIPLFTILFLALSPGTRYVSPHPHCRGHSPRAASAYGPMRSSCVASKSRWHVVHLAKSGPYSFGDVCTICRWHVMHRPCMALRYPAATPFCVPSFGLTTVSSDTLSAWHLEQAVAVARSFTWFVSRWQRTHPLLPPSFVAWEAWRKVSVVLYMSRWHLSHAVFLSKGRFLWWHLTQEESPPNFVMWRSCGKRTSRSSRLPLIISSGMRFDPSGTGTSFCNTLTSRRCPPVGGPTTPSSVR